METVRALLVLLFFLIVGCLLSVIQADEISHEEVQQKIVLEKVNNISNLFIRVKDLTSSAVDKRIGNVLISRRPLPNKSITLYRHQVEKLIRTQIRNVDLSQFEIPDEVLITYIPKKRNTVNKSNMVTSNTVNSLTNKQQVSTINMDEVLLLVTDHVKVKLKKYSAEVSLFSSNSKVDWKVKVGEGYDLKVLPGIFIKKNRIIAKIGVYYENKIINSRSISFKADIFVKVLITNAKFNKGHVASKSDFYWDHVPYSTKALSFVRDISFFKNKVFKRGVALGSGVLYSDVEMPVLIKKGALVRVVVKGKSFTIETHGIAKTSGKKGEMIEVMIYNTKKVVPCSIVGINQVNLL